MLKLLLQYLLTSADVNGNCKRERSPRALSATAEPQRAGGLLDGAEGVQGLDEGHDVLELRVLRLLLRGLRRGEHLEHQVLTGVLLFF